jgi:hypothetical protein
MEENPVEIKITPFSELLKLILSTSSFQLKYSIKLDPEFISILNQILISNPNYFDSIQQSFNSIIEDKKIDVNDIPAIITLLSNLYKILYSQKINDIVKGISTDKCLTILKFVIEVIIKENMNDNEKEIETIKIINSLIDTCGDLILIRKSLKTPTSFSFIK